MEGRAAKRQTSWKTLGIPLTVPVFVLLLLLGATGAEAQPTERIDGVDGDPSVGDPYYPRLGNSGYDVKHYDIELRIDPARRFARGSTSIELVLPRHASLFHPRSHGA